MPSPSLVWLCGLSTSKLKVLPNSLVWQTERLRVQFPVRAHIKSNRLMFLSHVDVCVSFSFSLSLKNKFFKKNKLWLIYLYARLPAIANILKAVLHHIQ